MKSLKLLIIIAGLLLVAGAFWILRFPQIVSLGDAAATLTFDIRERSGRAVPFKVGPRNAHWTPLRRIARPLRVCVIASEDDRFFSHHGFDFIELGRSVKRNVEAGGYVRGGSTITMQLARTLFLSGEKTMRRKIIEAVLTVQLEMTLDKSRILELYLNVVDWGSGIRGIGRAARVYYGKPASALTWGEAAYLAVMLPNPYRYNMSVRPRALRKRQHHLVGRLVREGRIPGARRAEALAAPSPRVLQ